MHYNILKNLIEKKLNKKCVLVLIEIVFLIIVEVFLAGKISYRENQENYSFDKNSIINIVGYNVIENKFIVTNNDPQLYLRSTDFAVKKVSLELEILAEQDVPVTLYGAEEQDYSEQNSAYKVIKKGDSKCEFIINRKNIHNIRLDVDADFSLKSFNIDSVESKHIKSTFAICLIIFFVFDSIVGVILYKKKVLQKFQGKIINIYLYIMNVKISNIFVIIAIVGGLMFSSLVPAFQIPDEYTHILFIEDELGLSGYANEINSYYNDIDAYNIQGNANIKQNVNLYKEKASKHFSRNLSLKMKPKISAIRHLPNEIGLVLGIVLKLPIFWCLFLAELGAVIFYAIIGKITLDLMPMKKSVLAIVMLLPMTLQQTSGINYDCFLLPLCFLLFAYIMSIIYADRMLNWKNLIFIILLTGCIAVTKIPYIFISLLVFAIPYEKYDLKIRKYDLGKFYWKFRYIFYMVGIAVCGLGIYIARNNVYIKCLLAAIKSGKDYLNLLNNTIKHFFEYYFQSSIGYFGWFDSKVSITFCLICLGVIVILMQENDLNKKLEKKIAVKVVAFDVIIILLISYFIFLGMYSFSMSYYNMDYTSGIDVLVTNIKNLSLIVGVQGRYFIPCMALFVVMIPNIIKIDRKKILVVQLIYYPCMLMYTYGILVERYWNDFAI